MNKKKQILFITPLLGSKTGGKLLTENIESILTGYFDLIHYDISGYRGSKIQKLLHAIIGYSHGERIHDYTKVKKIILDKNIDAVIINHSYYGIMAKKIKEEFPNLKIITYFHNVEYNFTYEIVKKTGKFSNWLIWKIVSKNEKLIVRNSDFLVGLNKRDNKSLYKIYHRNFDDIIPMFLNDSFKDENKECSNNDQPFPSRYGLFVGSLFYANYYGIKWFAENVCPFINIPILVVGKGFEKIKDEFVDVPNLVIIGEVDDLVTYYVNSDFVVSPIFEGSGMKTKTAEALMYGKWIIGTDESFEGYEISNGVTGFICNTQEEFIHAIMNFDNTQFNKAARELFVNRYSIDAISKKLITFINNVLNWSTSK